MPASYQIIPEGSMKRPKIRTYIYDNTEVNTTVAASGGGYMSSVLCVFSSPKGRDNQIITIDNGLSQFIEEFGMGPFKIYGQPLLNAYAAASAASTSHGVVHCLRVMPEDAAYSNVTLIAKYRADPTNETMEIGFVVKPSDDDLLDLEDLEDCCSVSGETDEEGFTSVKLLTIAYKGRGSYGRNLRFRITTDKASDKENKWKNYNFSILRNEETLDLIESYSGVLLDDWLF